jgi:hypothetical protein
VSLPRAGILILKSSEVNLFFRALTDSSKEVKKRVKNGRRNKSRGKTPPYAGFG